MHFLSVAKVCVVLTSSLHQNLNDADQGILPHYTTSCIKDHAVRAEEEEEQGRLSNLTNTLGGTGCKQVPGLHTHDANRKHPVSSQAVPREHGRHLALF